MTRVTCRLTASNRDKVPNPTLVNRVWATFTFFCSLCLLLSLSLLQAHCTAAVHREGRMQGRLRGAATQTVHLVYIFVCHSASHVSAGSSVISGITLCRSVHMLVPSRLCSMQSVFTCVTFLFLLPVAVRLWLFAQSCCSRLLLFLSFRLSTYSCY